MREAWNTLDDLGTLGKLRCGLDLGGDCSLELVDLGKEAFQDARMGLPQARHCEETRIRRKPLRRECRCIGVPVAFFFACEPRVRLVHAALPAPLLSRVSVMHHSRIRAAGM